MYSFWFGLDWDEICMCLLSCYEWCWHWRAVEGNKAHIVFVKAINITVFVYNGKHMQVAVFLAPCHTSCVFGFCAQCKHHMVWIFETRRNLVSHPGNQCNETNGSAVMWTTQEGSASDPFFLQTISFKKAGHMVLVVGCILCLTWEMGVWLK